VAEAEVAGSLETAGNAGFRVLAGYIFGRNRGRRRIPMTAPVTQTGEGARWVLRFGMPSGYSLETLPEPLEPSVRFRVVPARRVAALRYSGTWSERRYHEHVALLREAMVARGLRAAGEPEWARYNPPMLPWFLRRNEILIEVASG